MVRNRFCVYVVPYDVNVTDVNVTQSFFLTCVYVVPYVVNVTVICLKSEELHETCTTKKCTTSKYFEMFSSRGSSIFHEHKKNEIVITSEILLRILILFLISSFRSEHNI